jgi:hypothetical protein
MPENTFFKKILCLKISRTFPLAQSSATKVKKLHMEKAQIVRLQMHPHCETMQ